LCEDCERKDRVILGLKESVVKHARLEQITNLLIDVRYPSIKHKQKVIENLAKSGVDIELIRDIANDLNRMQGLDHKHYR
jgi:hypothetical protein